MKAMRHEMHISILALKHMKKVRDMEYITKHEHQEKTQGTRQVRYKTTITHEAREHVKHEAHEAREHV